jgi:hypothetical protein
MGSQVVDVFPFRDRLPIADYHRKHREYQPEKGMNEYFQWQPHGYSVE